MDRAGLPRRRLVFRMVAMFAWRPSACSPTSPCVAEMVHLRALGGALQSSLAQAAPGALERTEESTAPELQCLGKRFAVFVLEGLRARRIRTPWAARSRRCTRERRGWLSWPGWAPFHLVWFEPGRIQILGHDGASAGGCRILARLGVV